MSNKSAQQIEKWLVAQVAERLEVDADQLDLDQPLTEAGLSSREAIMLTGDLEDYVGYDLPPELFYDYPQIRELAQKLAAGPDALNEPVADASYADMQSFLKAQVSLLELMKERAHMHGDRKAFVYLKEGKEEAEAITYAQLHRRAKAIAAYLQSKNLSGERILLLHPSSIGFITGFLGCVYAKAIAVPAFPPLKRRGIERIATIVQDSSAKAALLTTELLAKSRSNNRFDEKSQFSNVTWVLSDTIDDTQAESWKEPTGIDRDTIAFLQYTSGSTGSPKGVMVSHGNVIHNSMLIAEVSELEAVDQLSTSVSWLPMYHDMGMIGNILYQMATGYTNYFMEPNTFLQRPLLWLQAISKYKAQHTASPNFAFEHSLEKIDPNQHYQLDLSSWTLAINGAEPVRAATLSRFYEVFGKYGLRSTTVSPSFGMAEATLIVTAVPMHEEANVLYLDPEALEQNRIVQVSAKTKGAVSKVSCGEPLMETIIVDPHTLEHLPDDHVGEIWLSGESVAQGYWMRPEETTLTFDAHTSASQGPYMRTGDLGFMHQRNMYFTGRIKDLIIIRGSNHYPQDIELTVQEAHPALTIDGAAAFSIDKHGSERLVILAEVNRTAMRELNKGEVMEAIRAAVSQVHDLQVYAVTLISPGRLPRTTSGKTQRRLAKLQFLDGSLHQLDAWQLPLSDMQMPAQELIIDLEELRTMDEQVKRATIEDYLISMISNVMRIPAEELNSDTPLVRLGLDSMHAVEIKGKLESYLETDIDITQLIQDTHIRGLASYVISALGDSEQKETPSEEVLAIDNMNAEELEQLMGRIDELSDEQVATLLTKLGA